MIANNKIKSFDFLVYHGDGAHWIVDVKGRRFPYIGAGTIKRYWENWVTQDDLIGLNEWQSVFGGNFKAIFVFCYHLLGSSERWPKTGRIHSFNNKYYTFLAVSVADYERHCRLRSGSWQTLSVPVRIFRSISIPL